MYYKEIYKEMDDLKTQGTKSYRTHSWQQHA